MTDVNLGDSAGARQWLYKYTRLCEEKHIRMILLILVVGWFLRLAAVIGVPARDFQTPWGRSISVPFIYHRLAVHLLDEGRLLNIANPPVYPFFLTGIYSVFGKGNLLAVRLIQTVLGGLVPLTIIWVAGTFCSRTASLSAGLITAINPFLIFYVPEIMASTLFVLLGVVSIFFFCRFLSGKSERYLLISAFFLSLTILTKTNAIAYVPAAVLTLLWKGGGSLKKRFRAVGIFSLVLIVILGGWMWRNYEVVGKWCLTSSTGRISMYGSTRYYLSKLTDLPVGYPELKDVVSMEDAEGIRYSQKRWLEYVMQDPWMEVKIIIVKWLHFFNPFLARCQPIMRRIVSAFFFLPILVLGGFALLLGGRDGLSPHRVYFLSLILITSTLHAVVVANIRYRTITIDPFLTIFALQYLFDIPWIRRRSFHVNADSNL